MPCVNEYSEQGVRKQKICPMYFKICPTYFKISRTYFCPKRRLCKLLKINKHFVDKNFVRKAQNE